MNQINHISDKMVWAKVRLCPGETECLRGDGGAGIAVTVAQVPREQT